MILATVYLLVGIYLGGLMLLSALVRRLFPEGGTGFAIFVASAWPAFLGWLLFGGRK